MERKDLYINNKAEKGYGNSLPSFESPFRFNDCSQSYNNKTGVCKKV